MKKLNIFQDISAFFCAFVIQRFGGFYAPIY